MKYSKLSTFSSPKIGDLNCHLLAVFQRRTFQSSPGCFPAAAAVAAAAAAVDVAGADPPPFSSFSASQSSPAG